MKKKEPSEKYRPVLVRLHPRILADLEELAEYRGLSMSAAVAESLESAVRKMRKAKKGK